MTIKADYFLQLKVRETFATSQQGAGSAVIDHELLGGSGTLNGASSVPATQVLDKRVTLVAGAATIDLTAAPGKTVDGSAIAIDLTGLKLQLLKLVAHKDNTARVKVAEGAANPYLLGGVTGAFDSLAAGEGVLHEFKNSLPDVDATHKNIDITSTMNTAIIDVLAVFG